MPTFLEWVDAKGEQHRSWFVMHTVAEAGAAARLCIFDDDSEAGAMAVLPLLGVKVGEPKHKRTGMARHQMRLDWAPALEKKMAGEPMFKAILGFQTDEGNKAWSKELSQASALETSNADSMKAIESSLDVVYKCVKRSKVRMDSSASRYIYITIPPCVSFP